ncbi:MAG: radical SAM family heme chaperone HemW [Bacteroidota bacterium]|nr:radical SAM family heme chaperone HemW [Bacteroidota bacterium]
MAIKNLNFTPLAGIYLHIPFCKQACTYCDFHFSVNMAAKSDLVKAILLEIDQRKEYLEGEEIETIYFGGGTPSVLNEDELNSILQKINKEFKAVKNAEITLECNPDDINEEKLEQLKNSGINRLSIGLQSFNEEELKWMNRAHSATESFNCVKLAQDKGFENITIDLIYGSKFQSRESWKKTLQSALNLNVQHISAYNLTIESKTKLGVDHKKGTEPGVSEDLSSEQFKTMIELLQKNDFVHYEISNFGKENYFSKHNSNYWKGAKYLGLGPSAHSFNTESRQWNVSSNSVYIQKVNVNEVYSEKEALSPQEHYNEYILTRLRTIWGCDTKEIEQRFGKEVLVSFESTVKKHQKYFDSKDGIITLNTEGKLRADFLASEFFN